MNETKTARCSHLTVNNSFKESSEIRRDFSFVFNKSLTKIKEGIQNVERPKSACLFYGDHERKTNERPRSWEPTQRRKITHGSKLFEVRECCCSHGFDSGSSCCWNYPEIKKETWTPLRYFVRSGRKCRSDLSVRTSKIFNSDIHKVKRTMKHLGFRLSDFGIFPSRTQTSPECKTDKKTSSITTKITDRSVSLDSLRSFVKRAWLEDGLDESHRRILAKAAYEEWYFRKEKELWEKRTQETKWRQQTAENLKEDIQLKKAKSEEEFQKWLKKKRIKKKENQGILKQNYENTFGRLKKTKEESEKAFMEWKKRKEKELAKKREEERKERERKIQSEKEKSEKKIIAEKAFQQWKSKLEELEKSEEVKKKLRQKEKQNEEERKKRQERSQISFDKWKTAKDEQIKQRIKQIREAERILREERQTQLEERMYEAEQAFEDWLEKVDYRKPNPGYRSYEKLVPWIPA